MNRINFRILIIYIFLYGPIIQLSGQFGQGGKPLEIDASLKSTIPVIDIVPAPLEELLMISDDEEAKRLKHLYFAKNFHLQVSPENSGRWTTHKDGYRIWHLGIRSEGAYSLGLMFNKFFLEGSARLFIFNEDRKNILGAFTSYNNKTSGILPVSHLPGECIYIQLEVPWKQAEYGELLIGEVAHAYLPVYTDKSLKDDRYGYSDTCNVDINCPEGADWQDLKRAVCRISVNNTKWCTGVLVNTTDLDPEPYILTVAHCVGSQNEANKSVVYFNYESPECDGPDGSISHSISGMELISTGDTLGDNLDRDSLDFSLLKLSINPPDSFNIYYAGWNRDTTRAEKTVTIHHPHGDVKKISIDNDPPETGYHTANYYPDYVLNSHWWIHEWDVATTEMGSSGAPLFDQDKRVIGLLTGGEANCALSVNDYYTKLDYSWDYYDSPFKHLKSWLDPPNTGVLAIDGREHVNYTELHRLEQIYIYPNPGNGKYTIQLNESVADDGILKVFSISGAVVFSDRIFNNGLYYFDLGHLPPGIYIVRLMFPDRIFTHKIIHQPK